MSYADEFTALMINHKSIQIMLYSLKSIYVYCVVIYYSYKIKLINTFHQSFFFNEISWLSLILKQVIIESFRLNFYF